MYGSLPSLSLGHDCTEKATLGVQGFKMDLLILGWSEETARYREGCCLVMEVAVPISSLWCLNGTPVWVLGACLDHDL